MCRPLIRVGVIVMAFYFAGCSYWKATQTPLAELEGKQVRVTTKTGKRTSGLLIDADSLGRAHLKSGSWLFVSKHKIDTTEIASVETRNEAAYNRVLALKAIGGIAITVAFFAWIVHKTSRPLE